jgi:hypothetical protein
MLKYQMREDGIKEYYDDFVDDAYQYFECPSCKRGNRELAELKHKSNCRLVITQTKRLKEYLKNKKIKAKALSKLTKTERKILGV